MAKSQNVKLILILWVVFTAGVILSPLFHGIASAYGEQDGPWTATEKRQVIQLLEEIRDSIRE